MTGANSRLRRALRTRGVVAIAVVAGLIAAAWFAFYRPNSPKTIERQRLEEETRRELIHQGVNASKVSCPGDLRAAKGREATCTYTEALPAALTLVVDPRNPPPPRTGRVEVRVTDVDVDRIGGQRATRLFTPEFEVDVIEPAPMPGAEHLDCPERLAPEVKRELADLGLSARALRRICRAGR